ncbi:MAG: transcriptional regulator [Bacillus thermozeamaize]|uniref:Transcriptional regulator n=1 Tax=Bacillus thermozeamaize TaxID=230954 RepID=A0A1Y3PMP4_9BACI|nr:MAG: transcriptional regulator [Bacillus thermozeamaize]
MRITQDELAKALHVTRQTINAIENNKFNPSLELAFKISKFFKRPIEEIFFYKGDELY